MDKHLNAKDYEEKWYKFWRDNNYLKSTPNSRPPFTIVMPPPNVTGSLHCGHALNNTLQDIAIRFKKLDGFNTCWVPGTDHGGIATQNMLEKELLKKGIKKSQLTRQEFLTHMQEWKESKRTTIIGQLQRLGCACDWDREQFTMSPELSMAVREAFCTLYNKGLIYQSNNYLVNWCCKCCTALSDDEVLHKEQPSKLYYIKYHLEDDPTKYITVATTRPETIFGDTAVAVNPLDARYTHLHNKRVIVPIVNRPVPIIADDRIHKDFGTGAVKVTPAHNKTDHEIAQQHKLEAIIIMDKYGRITDTKTKYDNIDRFKCRQLIINDLSIEKIEDHKNSIGVCYRCDTIIEPKKSLQYFLRMQPLIDQCRDAIDKQILFIPEHHKNIINTWFSKNIDWCISRQIWWGHQIPVWYCNNCANTMCETKDPQYCNKCTGPITQEQDVLDTWFSSALWPFSVFQDSTERKYYYPTDVLITGGDIIFFWVSRMIIMAAEFTNNIPFKTVYLHGIIRDENGEKMAKTKGNVIDPLEIINKYSADVLRFTLAFSTPKGDDMSLSPKMFELGKTFCTKLWNATRFILMSANKSYTTKIENPTTLDLWILHKLNSTIATTRKCLEDYDFMNATKALQNFVWDQFCSNYLELIKEYTDTNMNTAIMVLDTCLRLLHPIIPHLTEELWQKLKVHLPEYKGANSILDTSYPKVLTIPPDDQSYIDIILELMNIIRFTKHERKLGTTHTNILLCATDNKIIDAINNNIKAINRLTKSTITFEEMYISNPDFATTYIVGKIDS
jgi:valyl-tRNA synthetase